MEESAYSEMYEQEECHWWFRGRRRLIWALLKRASLANKPRVLDAGCGTGRNLIEFSALGPVAGVDSSSEAVEFCNRRGLDAVRAASIESLPFGSDEFDLLLACDVIEHVEDDDAALRELRRVAARGASLVITAPAYQWLWTDHDVSLHHKRRYTLRVLRDRVLGSGWEIVHATYYNTILLPVVAATRVLSRPGSRPGRTDLDRTPALLNGLLEHPLALEAALVAKGLRLPAGSSLGMLCRLPESG